MRASKIVSNPHKAAALIDDLISELEDLLRYAEKVTRNPHDPAFRGPRAVLNRAEDA